MNPREVFEGIVRANAPVIANAPDEATRLSALAFVVASAEGLAAALHAVRLDDDLRTVASAVAADAEARNGDSDVRRAARRLALNYATDDGRTAAHA